MVNIVQTGTLLRAKGGSTHNYARIVDIKTGTPCPVNKSWWFGLLQFTVFKYRRSGFARLLSATSLKF